MNTFFFDDDGKCLYSMNYIVDAEAYPDAGKVLHVEDELDPNEIWYDFGMSRLTNKTAFEETVVTNEIRNLPVGTFASVNGSTVVVDDGSLELEVSVSQDVPVLLSHVSRHTKQVEVPCEV
jgi:hypothetical protein